MTMADKGKVIKGLEFCIPIDEGEDCPRECPYYQDVCFGYSQLMRDALALLKEQESEWLEDSDPGQEYGTTWACRKCGHSIHEPFIWNPYDSGYKYCPHCGAIMKVRLDG